MGELQLKSLSVEGFRAFDRLELPALGRVNLLTGRNGVGKSCVLEALELLASGGSFYVARNQIWRRQELLDFDLETRSTNELLLQGIDALRSLFHGRPPLRPAPVFSISSHAQMVECCTGWDAAVEEWPHPADSLKQVAPFDAVWLWRQTQQSPPELLSGGFKLLDWGALLGVQVTSAKAEPPPIAWRFLGPDRDTGSTTATLWDDIALTDRADDVLHGLSLLGHRIHRLNYRTQIKRRVPEVMVDGLAEPVTVASLGTGAERLLSIAVRMATAAGGLLLLDEATTGLHYSLHEPLWRMVFEISRRLNVQVFATTHSWDCIEGFQAAADADDGHEARLFRLDSVPAGLHVTVFDERRLALATRNQIEVR